MPTLLRVILGLLVIITSSCWNSSPNEIRAVQIVNEINGLNRKPYNENFNEVLQAMSRLHDVRESFPNRRDFANADVRTSRAFFTATIGEHQYIITLLQELSSLRVSDLDPECISKAIDTEHLRIESSESTMDQITLLLDQSIEDKATLELRLEPLIKKGDAANQSIDELIVTQKQQCQNVFGYK